MQQNSTRILAFLFSSPKLAGGDPINRYGDSSLTLDHALLLCSEMSEPHPFVKSNDEPARRSIFAATLATRYGESTSAININSKNGFCRDLSVDLGHAIQHFFVDISQFRVWLVASDPGIDGISSPSSVSELILRVLLMSSSMSSGSPLLLSLRDCLGSQCNDLSYPVWTLWFPSFHLGLLPTVPHPQC